MAYRGEGLSISEIMYMSSRIALIELKKKKEKKKIRIGMKSAFIFGAALEFDQIGDPPR